MDNAIPPVYTVSHFWMISPCIMSCPSSLFQLEICQITEARCFQNATSLWLQPQRAGTVNTLPCKVTLWQQTSLLQRNLSNLLGHLTLFSSLFQYCLPKAPTAINTLLIYQRLMTSITLITGPRTNTHAVHAHTANVAVLFIVSFAASVALSFFSSFGWFHGWNELALLRATAVIVYCQAPLIPCYSSVEMRLLSSSNWEQPAV